MADIVTVAGSPSESSRSAAVLGYVRALAEQHGLTTASIVVRRLPAEALLGTNFSDPGERRRAHCGAGW